MRVMSSRSNVEQRHVRRIKMFEWGEISEIVFPEDSSVLSENAKDLEIERQDVSSPLAPGEQYLPFRRM